MTTKIQSVRSGYGLTLEASEWQLDLRLTTRQDGKTSVAVILTQVDDVVQVAGPELVRTTQDDLNKTVHNMVDDVCDSWISPYGQNEIEVIKERLTAWFKSDLDFVN